MQPPKKTQYKIPKNELSWKTEPHVVPQRFDMPEFVRGTGALNDITWDVITPTLGVTRAGLNALKGAKLAWDISRPNTISLLKNPPTYKSVLKNFTKKSAAEVASAFLPFAKGGEIPRKPIFVSDPNDHRLRAYNDSNDLYNRAINVETKIKKWYETDADQEVINSRKEETLPFNEMLKRMGNERKIKNFNNEKNFEGVNKNIQPIGGKIIHYDVPYIEAATDKKGHVMKDKNGKIINKKVLKSINHYLPVYQEPVQPYVYKKPANNKPKLNTYDDYLNAVKKLGANPRGSQGMSEAYALVNEMTKKFPYQETYLENGYNIPKRPVVYQKPVANNPQPKTVNKPVAKPVTVLKKDYWNTDKDVLAFRKKFVEKFGEEPSRDPNIAKYDYDKAYKAGVKPVLDSTDGLYHWDSEFKHDDHPNLIVNGVNTKTGKPVEQKVEQPVKPVYTSKKQLFQGSDFTLQTGLRPGLYHPEEIEEIKKQKKGQPVSKVIPKYDEGGEITMENNKTLPKYRYVKGKFIPMHAFGDTKIGTELKQGDVIAPALNIAQGFTDQNTNPMLSEALNYGAQGASMGAMFGPWGAAIGGGVGLVGGAVKGYFDKEEQDAKKAQFEQSKKNQLAYASLMGRGDNSNLGIKTNTQNLYAHGGMKTISRNHPNPQEEVEGGESAITPNGQNIQFKGPKHDNGGIKTNLPSGTRIFSDRIIYPG